MLVAKQFGVFLHLQEVLVWLLLIVGPGNSQPLAILGLLLVEPVLIPVDVDPARDVREHAGRILDVTLQLTDAGAQLRVGPRPGVDFGVSVRLRCDIMVEVYRLPKASPKKNNLI